LFDNIAGYDGHGFQITSKRYTYSILFPLLSWAGLVENPVQIQVSDVSTELTLAVDVDYTVDWVARTVSMVDSGRDGHVINISVYELGGGSQLYRQNYIGNDVGNILIVPVSSVEIYDPVLFVNGVYTEIRQLGSILSRRTMESIGCIYQIDSGVIPLDL